jgi:hypothetical protein
MSETISSRHGHPIDEDKEPTVPIPLSEIQKKLRANPEPSAPRVILADYDGFRTADRNANVISRTERGHAGRWVAAGIGVLGLATAIAGVSIYNDAHANRTHYVATEPSPHNYLTSPAASPSASLSPLAVRTSASSSAIPTTPHASVIEMSAAPKPTTPKPLPTTARPTPSESLATYDCQLTPGANSDPTIQCTNAVTPVDIMNVAEPELKITATSTNIYYGKSDHLTVGTKPSVSVYEVVNGNTTTGFIPVTDLPPADRPS